MAFLKKSQSIILTLLFFNYLSFFICCTSIEKFYYTVFAVATWKGRIAYLLGYMFRFILPSFTAANFADSYYGQVTVLKWSFVMEFTGLFLLFLGAVYGVYYHNLYVSNSEYLISMVYSPSLSWESLVIFVFYMIAVCGWGATVPLCYALYLNQDQESKPIEKIHLQNNLKPENNEKCNHKNIKTDFSSTNFYKNNGIAKIYIFYAVIVFSTIISYLISFSGNSYDYGNMTFNVSKSNYVILFGAALVASLTALIISISLSTELAKNLNYYRIKILIFYY